MHWLWKKSGFGGYPPTSPAGPKVCCKPGINYHGCDMDQSAISKHYDAVASDYECQHGRDGLRDLSRPYPADYFRLQLLLNSFASKGIKCVTEVGVGEGIPLATLGRAGIDVWV